MPSIPFHGSPIKLSSHQRGATLRELLIVVVLFIIFIFVAMQKIWELRVAAEQTAVEVMVGNMRSALGAEVARLAVGGNVDDIARHDGGNPIMLMQSIPLAYEGALRGADPATVAGYSWYYDTDAQVLVYRVANEEAFDTPLEGPARILFRQSLSYVDTNRNGQYDQGIDTIQGLNLISLHPYRWHLKGSEPLEMER